MKFLSKHTVQLVIVSSWGIIPNFFKLQIFMIRCSFHKCGLYLLGKLLVSGRVCSFFNGCIIKHRNSSSNTTIIYIYIGYIGMQISRIVYVTCILHSLWGLHIPPTVRKAGCVMLCLQLTEVNRKGTLAYIWWLKSFKLGYVCKYETCNILQCGPLVLISI